MIVRKTVKIEVEKAIKALKLWDFAEALGASLTPNKVIRVEASVELEAGEFDDEDIEKEYAKRFNSADESEVIADIYQYLAAGDVNEAMEMMQREFGLPMIAHEKKLTDLIARGRAKEASHVEN